MPYCEEYGAKLSAGVRFCEECGTPVASVAYGEGFPSAPASPVDIFAGSDWESEWAAFVADAAGLETGLILTRQAELLSQTGMGEDRFRSLLSEYIDSCRGRGVAYAYLDLEAFRGGGSSPDETVDAIKRVAQVAKPSPMKRRMNSQGRGIRERHRHHRLHDIRQREKRRSPRPDGHLHGE